MRIALITYHYSNNKGAFMQTYALCRYLRDLGHELKIIDIRLKEYTPWYTKFVKDIIVGFRLKREMKLYYPPLTRRYNDLKELQNNPPVADCYIVGSDQVWNPNISKELMLAYYLDFGDSKTIRISYASSFGLSKWVISDNKINSRISELLNSFKALSVREQQGRDLCNHVFGLEPQIVLDPTFLNTNYHEIYKPIKIRKEIVCYKINKTKDFWENALSVGKSLGLPLTLLNYNYPKRGFNYCFPPSLKTWLKRIEEAEFVLTDSFHGIALSIINRKQFVAILNHNDRDSRLINLMETMGLQDRLFSSLSEMLKSESWKDRIDYTKLEPVINKQIELSRLFIKNALSTNEDTER